MSMPVRIDNALYEMVRAQANAERRTIAGQTIPPRVSCYYSARTRISIGN